MNKIMPSLMIGAVLVSALAATGCVVRARPASVHVAATAPTATVVATPGLVSISPNVYVVEDYNEPVFYSDGYYWLYRNGLWYQSSVHTGGWAVVRTNYVPVHVRRIDRPRSYVRYRARPGVRVHRGPPARVRGTTRVRTRPGVRTQPARTRVYDNRSRPTNVRVRDNRSRPQPATRVKVKDKRKTKVIDRRKR